MSGSGARTVGSDSLPLQASEIRYRRLFESARDGIFILDAEDGRIIDVNPYLAELLGYPREAILGRQIWDFGPFKDIVASKEAYEVLQAKDYVAYEDLPLETSDGRRIEVGFVSNVYEVEGARYIQCNIRDLTLRKAEERARTHLEDQLRSSQKMEAIGALAGGIAHDFNNLLSVILCYTGLAIESLPSGHPARIDLLEVEQASQRAAALTRQLLAFSRKQQLNPEPLDLNEVVVGIEKMLRRVLCEDITIVLNLSQDLGLTLADRSQIEQVLVNLLVNARDAMPHGGTITIETDNVDVAPGVAAKRNSGPAPFVRVAVSDTGLGMDPRTLERIFEPFFTTKEPWQGTGLGLSTVHGIVNQSGGRISVASEPRVGTHFEVLLPREDGASRPKSLPILEREGNGNETILVVEDDEGVRRLTDRILTAAGYRVLTAANGREALVVCGAFADDIPLVVTDIRMPHLGGLGLAEELRALRPSTRILYMSGYSEDAIADRLEAGVAFIGKPFDSNELTRRVREVLDQERVRPRVIS